MNYSTEVLIYIESVKAYLLKNKKVLDYFVGNGDFDEFFQKLKDTAQENYVKLGSPILNKEQFESIKNIEANLTINNENYYLYDSKYGYIYLN